MIVKAVDSEFPPDPESVALAKGDAVAGWNGYLPGPNIAHGWQAADFAPIRAAGLHAIAYASGAADPLIMKAMAQAYGVRGCLDVEGAIRGDGPWVQPWLDASGFGLYGNEPVHQGRRAPFHVLAAYPGHDPGASWGSGPKPPVPTGWQWAGSVHKYGMTVDQCWFDEAIYASPTPPPHPGTPGNPEETMVLVNSASGTIYLLTGTYCIPISFPADAAAFRAAGIGETSTISAQFEALLKKLPQS